jgi:sugar/nucleoside kinase (ribokinase family)
MYANKKNIDLTCLGILVLDALAKTINEFPSEGTSVYYDSVQLLPGGCAYNTGVDAKRWGLTVSIQGKVGNDPFGDIIINFLKKENISTDKIARGEENTAFSFVMIPNNGQRRIYNTQGANTAFGLDDIDFDTVKDSKVMHIGGSSLMPKLDGAPTIELLKFCRENSVITSMDPVFKIGIADLIVPALPYLDIFLPNTEESEHITGLKKPEDQLNFYLNKGCWDHGCKNGRKGCVDLRWERKI